MKILTVNTGSTSIKLHLISIENDGTITRNHTECLQSTTESVGVQLKQFLCNAGVDSVVAAVHRVVHGGLDLIDSCVIDRNVEKTIERLSCMAPLHNPLALSWIRMCRQALDVVQIAVFDTAFFANLPDVAKVYAIPQALATQHGIRRYGFHGIAHRAMWQQWCQLRPDLAAGGNVITLQLGGGCSITAIKKGAPLDTSMGFSPTEGLVMATRCGDIDPGAIVHLLQHGNLSPEGVAELINTKSGLLGLSGESADLRDLIDKGGAGLQLAVELYCYRVKKYIGAYQAVLAGADGIVFGGGVGQHLPAIRDKILSNMQWCGIELDRTTNHRACGAAMQISTTGSRVDVRTVAVDEALVLANEAHNLLKKHSGVSP